FQNREPDSTENHVLAISERRELILCVGECAKVDVRRLSITQLEMAGDEVGVKVSQEHMANPATQPVGILDVLIDVPLWSDHRCDAAPLVSDKIGSMSEAAEVVLLEDHRPAP